MLAYIVAGLIMGGLAWYLKHEPGDPRLTALLSVGVVGSLVGGVGTNLFLGEGVMAVDPWGFAGAAILALVGLGLLQARSGQRPSSVREDAAPPRG